MITASLPDRFSDLFATQSDVAALVWQGERLSYGELGELVARFDRALSGLDLPSDRPVGIRAKKSPQAIALIISCLRAGHAFLLPSVELAPETLDQLFAQADVSLVVSPQESGALASYEPPRSGEVHWPPPAPEDVSFMLTTSGSTGLPKIVPLETQAIDRFTDWAAGQFEITPGKAVLNYAPLNFDLCLLDIWCTLKHGATVVLVDQDRATNGAYLADLIAGNGVAVVQAVPMLFRLLIDEAKAGGRTFPEVEFAMTTGDKIPSTTLKELPGILPNARFFNIYGCTETNDSLVAELDLSDGPPANVPIGQPIPGVIARIEDADGNPVEGEGQGELIVWTPFQTKGYLKAELNEGKLVSVDEGDGPRPYFRTGDIVQRAPDGTISIIGRADFYVKVRGVRVSTQVVEQAIQEHPDVIECAVVAAPDPLAGARLHACVRKGPDSKLNSLVLRKHCSERLARTEMPSTVEIVTAPLPKTSTGKVDRNRIGPHQKGAEASG